MPRCGAASAIFEGNARSGAGSTRIAHNVAVTHMITGRRARRTALVGLDEIAELPDADDPEQDTGERSLGDAPARRDPPALQACRPRRSCCSTSRTCPPPRSARSPASSPSAVAVRIHRLKALLAEPYRAEEKRARTTIRPSRPRRASVEIGGALPLEEVRKGADKFYRIDPAAQPRSGIRRLRDGRGRCVLRLRVRAAATCCAGHRLGPDRAGGGLRRLAAPPPRLGGPAGDAPGAMPLA